MFQITLSSYIRLRNFFENGLAIRWEFINKNAVQIYANTDEKKDDFEFDNYAIKLGVAFRGPIFGLLIGYSISLTTFIMEYIYLLFIRLLLSYSMLFI